MHIQSTAPGTHTVRHDTCITHRRSCYHHPPGAFALKERKRFISDVTPLTSTYLAFRSHRKTPCVCASLGDAREQGVALPLQYVRKIAMVVRSGVRGQPIQYRQEERENDGAAIRVNSRHQNITVRSTTWYNNKFTHSFFIVSPPPSGMSNIVHRPVYVPQLGEIAPPARVYGGNNVGTTWIVISAEGLPRALVLLQRLLREHVFPIAPVCVAVPNLRSGVRLVLPLRNFLPEQQEGEVGVGEVFLF